MRVHLINIASDAASYLRDDKRRAKPFIEFAEGHSGDAQKLRDMLVKARDRYAAGDNVRLAELMDELLRRLDGLLQPPARN